MPSPCGDNLYEISDVTNRDSHSQYFATYQEYIIILATNKLIGPMTVAQYDDFVAKNSTLLAGINLLEKSDRFDGSGIPLSELGTCTNPRPA